MEESYREGLLAAGRVGCLLKEAAGTEYGLAQGATNAHNELDIQLTYSSDKTLPDYCPLRTDECSNSSC